MKNPSLTRIIPWAHQLLAEVLGEGDLAVDLTAGNGHDTLFLSSSVGPTGRVFSFDIQPQALTATAFRLDEEGIASRLVEKPDETEAETSPVILVHACHSRLVDYLAGAPKAVIANLGYLPGGDHSLVTRPQSTRLALGAALDTLALGGRLAVVVYVAHPGGAAEADVVEALFAALKPDVWQVMRLQALNRPQAPYLLVAQKSG